MEIISMTCRQCSGSLKISKDADQIICQHCGTEYLISFNEGAISVKLLSEGLKKIQVSTDKTASELALVRLKAERDLLMMKIRDEIKDALASAGFGKIPEKLINDPYKIRAYISDELEIENKKSFLTRRPLKIDYLKLKLQTISKIIQTYEEIINQENYYLKQVRGK